MTLHCRDCDKWYGSEDDGYGPCTVKSQRGEKKPLTYGGHPCDEGFDLVGGRIVAAKVPTGGPTQAPLKAPVKAPTKRKG